MKNYFSHLFLLTLFYCSLNAAQGISLSDSYHKNSTLQWDLAMESLTHFPLNPGDKILDVGSGDGKITAHIAKCVPNGVVVGLDISEQMILKATSLFQNENLLFIQGTATHIPFKGQFDKIVSFSTLHWVLEQDIALQSMKESLKPHGTLLLLLYGQSPNNVFSVAKIVAAEPKWSSYFSELKQERVYYTLGEYKTLLESADLDICSLEAKEVISFYKDRSALLSFTKPLINFIDHLTPELKDLFINDIIDQMIKNDPILPDGSIGIHHVVIEVIAAKKESCEHHFK